MTRMTLPAQGRDWDTLKAEMTGMAKGDVDWRSGKLAVYIFNAGEDVLDVGHDAYGLFTSENGLGPLAFPSVATMEKQVIEIGLSLLHAPDTGWGAMTSGGSESIMCAVKAARAYAKQTKGLKAGEGEIILPLTAHPAFDKAAQTLELSVKRIPVSMPSGEADTAAMRAAVTEKTIMIVGSAPNFPYGVVDPIPELSALALELDLWLHVDACVGGYFAPFAKELGVDIPDFDFTNPGVSSISADLHKYGYAPKGASTVFYSDEAKAQGQTFTFDNWPGGFMYTPTMAGTRPAGAIAAAWAVMNYLGHEGFLETTRKALGAANLLRDHITGHNDLEVIGTSKLALVGYRSNRHDAGQILGGMMEKGWFSAFVSDPKGVHVMLSPKHVEVIDTYIEDLTDVLAKLDSGADQDSKEVRYSG